MKTKGIEVPADASGSPLGYLMFGFKRPDGTWTPSLNMVPDAFWARLKHAVVARGQVDAFKAEEAEAKAAGAFSGPLNAEQALFARWVRLLEFPIPAGHYPGDQLWPWTRGWTEDAVDAYLQAPLRRVA